MKRIKIKQLFVQKESLKDQVVTICGWVRTNRAQAQFGFLNINDGSFFENLQVVYDTKITNFEEVSKFANNKVHMELLFGSMDYGLVVDTLEGYMLASEGDFIIKGLRGEFYPCKPDVFYKKYEEVESY